MFVIEYRNRRGEPRGFVGSVADPAGSLDSARRFAGAADAMAWIAAHPMPEGLANAGWTRTIAATAGAGGGVGVGAGTEKGGGLIMATVEAVRERPILFSGPMIQAILAGKKSQTRRVVNPQPEPGWGVCVCHYSRTGFAWERPDGACTCKPAPYRLGGWGDRLWVRETWRAYEDPKTLIDGILYRADGAFRPIEPTREAAERWADAAHVKPRREDMAPVPGSPGLTVAVCRKAAGWRPPIHMPRWASRLTLEIESVRVERLQAISEADAIAEGLEVRMGDGTGPGPGFKWDGPAYWDGFSTHSDGISGKTYHAPARSGLCCCFVGEREGLSPARCAYRHLWDHINGKRPGCSWESNPFVWCISFKVVEPAVAGGEG